LRNSLITKQARVLKEPAKHLALVYVILAATLAYLGMPIVGSFLAPLFPIAAGCLGFCIIATATNRKQPLPDLLVLIGPGFILGLTVLSVACLLFGERIGLAVSVVLLLWSVARVIRLDVFTYVDGKSISVTGSLALILISLALLDLSHNFPVLATAALGLGIAGSIVWRGRVDAVSIVSGIGVLALLVVSSLRRPPFWWALNGSDDPIALMAAGVQFFRFGVSDISGWPTDNTPPIALVAPVIWSKLTFSPLIETYLLANPVFLAIAGFASVGVFVMLVSSSSRPFLKVGIAGLFLSSTAGLVGQSPKAHHVVFVACVALLQLVVFRADSLRDVRRYSQIVSRVVCLATPLVLGLWYHPTLFPMASLLLLGWIYLRWSNRSDKRLLWPIALLSVMAVAGGLFLMATAGAYLQGRVHGEAVVIAWLPQAEFGWCLRNDAPSSVFCRMVLESHFTSLLLIGLGLTAINVRRNTTLLSRLLLPLPAAFGYLPFLMLVTSSISASGSHLVELSRIAIVLLIAGLVVQHIDQTTQRQWIVVVTATMTSFIVYLSNTLEEAFRYSAHRVISDIYFLQPLLSFLDQPRLLVVSGVLTLLFGAVFTRPIRATSLVFALSLCLVLSANADLVLERARVTPWQDVTRRPSILGPHELEPLGDFIRKHLPNEAVLATNYLCVQQDAGRCTSAEVARSLAPDQLPGNISSWMISALGERRVLYLSQGWYTNNSSVELFVRSVEFGQNPSRFSASRLKDLGVTHYVAARELMTDSAWSRVSPFAVYTSDLFSVIEVQTALSELN